MSIWLIRAGQHGEYESKFQQEGRVYVTWDLLNVNLANLSDRSQLNAAMTERYTDRKPKTIQNWVSQVWPFAHAMQKGDLVVMPLKSQRSIQMGEITGDYTFEPNGPDPFFHWRSVNWIGEPVPRSHFGKDLLNTFGAFMTICRVQRNNAEARINRMRATGWQPETIASITQSEPVGEASDENEADTDIEERALDQIAQLIAARFKGHGLTRLVEGILKAQGYTTYRSPEGADGGADILAGAGPLGFGKPRLCVEVKSQSDPVDRTTVDKLLGAVSKFQADEGLFVSWGGFKGNVQKDLATSFFRVRLWTQKDLLEALFAHYDRLDDDLKAELPLKRIWTVTAQDE
ncbi:MAG: restriction endonuclease [Spirochaetae bacterium HGW-Spirochaetae-10]|nr:MAG: restriction endonuclease [Spirochaetae bacterium HGW-Spirochaetae-10]